MTVGASGAAWSSSRQSIWHNEALTASTFRETPPAKLSSTVSLRAGLSSSSLLSCLHEHSRQENRRTIMLILPALCIEFGQVTALDISISAALLDYYELDVLSAGVIEDSVRVF